MGKAGSAIAMTLITVLTLGFGAFITGIWAFIDLFLIMGWMQEDQLSIENRVVTRNTKSSQHTSPLGIVLRK